MINTEREFMINETVYKIALAGYFHDVGKFAERARAKEGDDKGFFIDVESIENNSGLYQPSYRGRYTHSHAVYTAAFIDRIEKLLPPKFNKNEWGLGDSFVNLAAGHHKPETPFQWIVAIADRVSSGFDRKEFDEKYNKEIGVQDYKKTRLLTIFEGLSADESKWKSDRLEDYQYRYPLKELSPDNIFPVNNSEVRQIDSEQASKDYRELFFKFTDALEKLSHKEYIHLWFEHFDSLFMIYASHIPAATVGYIVPDVSLYDHSRATSAIASAIYQYHTETNTMTIEAICDYETKKFLLISGDFYGIQDFIFTEGGSTGKASAKLLRGRSFYVSLLSELAADMICRELGIPFTSIILNAAGKFTILAHNTDNAKNIVETIEKELNKWLIKNFFGQASMGLSMIEASPDDFVSGKFADLWEKLSRAVDRKKYSKFDIFQHSGCVSDYLDSFHNKLGICPFCNKRPANSSAEVMEEYACKICADHIFIGENLVKNDQIAITAVDAELHGRKLLEPIFGRYQLAFPTGELKEMARVGKLFKFWNIGISKDGHIAKNITTKFLNGYVPKYDEEDLYDDRYLAGKKSDKKKQEMIDQIKADKDDNVPKTFAHIAVKALNFTDAPHKFRGIEALGVLKADVDNLGLLFACGMRKEQLTLSRLATMSRQLNNYFSIFIPYILKNDKRFNDIYTVFSGGDDLFLIGPWNRIIDFASLLNDSFKEYVCQNSHITISAGFSIHKPNEPVLRLAKITEHALIMSKSKGRDSITIFNEAAKWSDFVHFKGITETIEQWLDSDKINNAMLFRLNELIEMRRQERDLLTKSGSIYLEDMECLKWRARLKYTIVRNIGRKLKSDEKQKAINEVMQVAEWLEKYGGALRIPLWWIIYNRR